MADYLEIGADWAALTVPLNDFSRHGVDLTHLESLEVVFEWNDMSGTIYLDDVGFGELSTSETYP